MAYSVCHTPLESYVRYYLKFLNFIIRFQIILLSVVSVSEEVTYFLRTLLMVLNMLSFAK